MQPASLLTLCRSALRFSDEAIAGILGIEQDYTIPAVAAVGDAPAVPAQTIRRQLKPLENGDFLPETPAGLILGCIEDIKVFLTNQVVKTLEKGGSSTNRYMGLLHRSVKKKFGMKFEQNKANWYHPKSSKDIASAQNDRSQKMIDYAAHLSEAGNSRFVSTAQIVGFPFKLDPLLCQMYNREDLLEGRFFPPNTHLDIHVSLKNNLGLALRSLSADETADQAARLALRNGNPSVVIDELVLLVDKIVFPEGHPFVLSMEKKRKTVEALMFTLNAQNEIREAILPNQTEHRMRINLTQLQYPAYLLICWMRQQNTDGSNGYNLNTTSYRFPPNLDSIDITFAGSSLLATGCPVTKLSSARIDTIEKAILCKDQANFRRDPDSLSDFYSAVALQQYLVIPLAPLYAHKPPSEWGTLSPIFVDCGFTADLSPAGWQTLVKSVTEGQLGLRGDGSHYMLNAAATKIDG